MPEENNDKLIAFIENHLERVRQEVRSPSEELRVLNAIVSSDKLTLAEFMVLSNSDCALDLRGINNTTDLSTNPDSEKRQDHIRSPAGINFDFDGQNRKSPTIIERQVDERISSLEKKGVSPDPLPEVNSTSMGGFLSNMTDYVARTIAIPTATEILEARKNPKDARTFAQIPNVLADELFKVVSAGGDIKKMPKKAVNRIIFGGGAFIAAKVSSNFLGINLDDPIKLGSRSISKETGVQAGVAISVATYVGERLGLSRDDTDNFANFTIAALNSGSLSLGLRKASEKFLFNQMWRESGGSKDLRSVNLSDAKEKYFLSKEVANTAMNYFSLGVDTVAEVAKQTISGANPYIGSFALGLIAEQTVKIGAQGLLLGSVVALKNYFTKDKSVQEQNPELIAATVASLSMEEERIKRANPELNIPVEENLLEEKDLDREVGEATAKLWSELPAIPKAIRGNVDLLKQVKKAAAPAVKVMKESKHKDSIVIPIGSREKGSSQERK